MIVAFLARTWLHYPDGVDDFLDEEQASNEMRMQITTSEPVETVGALLATRSITFLRDQVILGSEQLRALYIALIAKAAECKDLRSWLGYCIREVVNLVYGGEVMRRQTKEADGN